MHRIAVYNVNLICATLCSKLSESTFIKMQPFFNFFLSEKNVQLNPKLLSFAYSYHYFQTMHYGLLK